MYYCTHLFVTLQKPLGLLSLLDEESTFPKATDFSFANKLKQQLSGNSCFKGEKEGTFKICHYAGEVGQSSSCFIFKLFLISNISRSASLPIQLSVMIICCWSSSICNMITVLILIPGDIWYNWVPGEEQRSIALWVNPTTIIM